MRALRWVVSAATLATGLGVGGLAFGWERDDFHQSRREEARIEYQRRLERCGNWEGCRRRARRAYRHDLARIDRHEF